MKTTWVFQRGCQESLFQINKQTLGKERANQKKKTHKESFLKKGLMDIKQIKNWFVERKDNNKKTK